MLRDDDDALYGELEDGGQARAEGEDADQTEVSGDRSDDAWADAPTRRFHFGRVIKLGLDGGFGFVRAPGGLMAFFDRGDTPEFGRLRVGSRVRFELDPEQHEHALELRVAP